MAGSVRRRITRLQVNHDAPRDDYVVVTDGWIALTFRKVGEVIQLTQSQAKYLLLAGIVTKK